MMSRSVSVIVTASSDDVFTRVFSSESIDGGPPIELETCSVRPAVQLVRNVLRRVDADVAGVTDAPQNDPVDMVVAVDSETTAADKVTADQIAEVQKRTAEAVAKGDRTLSSNKGTSGSSNSSSQGSSSSRKEHTHT